MFKKPYYLGARIIAYILVQAFLVTNIAWAQGADLLPQKHAISNAYLSPQLSINIPDIRAGFIYFSKADALSSDPRNNLAAASFSNPESKVNTASQAQTGIRKFASFIYKNLWRIFAAGVFLAGTVYAADETLIEFEIKFSILNEITAFIVAYIAGCGISVGLRKIIAKYAPNLSPKKTMYMQGALTWIACVLVLNYYFYTACLVLFSFHGLMAPCFILAVLLFMRETSRQHRASIYDRISYKELAKDPFLENKTAEVFLLVAGDVILLLLNLAGALLSAYPLIFFPVNAVALRTMFNRALEQKLEEIMLHIFRNYGSAEEFLREYINHRPDIGVFMFSKNRTKLYHLTTGAAGSMVAMSATDREDLVFYNKFPGLAYRFFPWWVPTTQNIRQLPIGVKDKDPAKETAAKDELGGLVAQRAPAADDKQEVITLKRLTSGFLMSRADILYPEIRDKVLKYGDDLKALRELGIVVSLFQKKHFKAKKDRLNKVINTLRGDYPELTQVPVYLVTGLDRVAEYIPDQAILVDNRPPVFIIELALIDEAMHRRHSRLPLAEQEILSVCRQAMELDKIFARRGLDFKRAMGMLSQYDAHAKTDFVKMLGLLYGIRYLEYIEQRRRIVAWANSNKGVFDKELTRAFEALGASLPFKMHAAGVINQPNLIEQAI
ncbi:MAG: hypothetical protein ABII75_07170 [Candidatus Omnitrophota bacterium]